MRTEASGLPAESDPHQSANRDRAAAIGLLARSTTVHGARTTFIDEGSGRSVLLLHGAPVTSLAFVRVIRELRRSYRVIAPDFPGFGGSEMPRGFTSTLGEYADFVVSFCKSLDLHDVVLYVNDSSGSIGIAAAARSVPLVSAMVIADTVPIPLTGSALPVGLVLRYVASSRAVRVVNRKLNLLPWLVATVAPCMRPFTCTERETLLREFDTPEKRDRVIDLFEQMGSDKEFMRDTVGMACERLSQLPVLILYGQLDPMRLIGGVRRFRDLFPNSTVAIVPREEHFPILASGEDVGRRVHEWIVGSVPAERPGVAAPSVAAAESHA